jgi:hypothetical protein
MAAARRAAADIFFRVDAKSKTHEVQWLCFVFAAQAAYNLSWSMLCTCPPAPALLAPWAEVMETHGIAADESAPNTDPRWPHNAFATDAVLRACGRPCSSSVNAPAHEHAPGDAPRCTAAARAMAAALEGLYVQRGDEGDHAWFAFASPGLLLPAEGGGQGGGALESLVTEAELRAACGGALSPRIAYTSSTLAEEVAAVRAREEPQAGEAAALEALLAAPPQAEGLGAGVTFLRPREPGGPGLLPSVYTFFLLRRTVGGGLCGVAGHAVWT